MAGLSDSELAFKLQLEEALALSTSLVSRSSTAPPSPTIVHRCGVVTVLNDDRESPAGERGGGHGKPLAPPQPPIDHRCGVVTVLNDDRNSSLGDRSGVLGKPPAPTPPIAHRCGVVTVLNDDRRNSAGDRSGGLGKSATGGGRDEKPHGKGNIYENAIGFGGGYRRTSGISGIHGNSAGSSNTGKPSAVIRQEGSILPANSIGEGSSKSKLVGDGLYRLYFKGLVSEETGDDKNTALLAGFGVAICDTADNVWFEMKGPLYGTGSSRQATEIRALMRGLEEAVLLGIKHIAIYCDYYPIYQYLFGRWVPKQKKIALLMDDLQRLRQSLASSNPVLVTRNDIKFAFKLAREAIVCQISPPPKGTRRVVAPRKETCVICLDDSDAERMFSVDKCLHRYCFSCVNQYVEVKLLRGIIPKCPHDGCKSVLSIDSCGKLLTPKLVDMWKKRIKEDSIPVTEKVYCPYPKCSALMSKTQLSRSAESSSVRSNGSGVRKCVECRGLFCINCKVPWHTNLSCTDYKKLHPNPPADDVKLKSLANNNKWRQCVKCHHMIELSQGCYHITCRCGYEFCYKCGAEWNKIEQRCPSSCPLWHETLLMPRGAGFMLGDGDEDDEDYYDEDDYDYDMEDYMGFGPDGPFPYGLEDELNHIGHLATLFEYLGHPRDDHTLLIPSHPFYHFSDEDDWDHHPLHAPADAAGDRYIDDDVDWDYDEEAYHASFAPGPSGGSTTVFHDHANSAGGLYIDDDWDYHHEEEEYPVGAAGPYGGSTAVHDHVNASGGGQYIDDDWDYDHHQEEGAYVPRAAGPSGGAPAVHAPHANAADPYGGGGDRAFDGRRHHHHHDPYDGDYYYDYSGMDEHFEDSLDPHYSDFDRW